MNTYGSIKVMLTLMATAPYTLPAITKAGDIDTLRMRLRIDYTASFSTDAGTYLQEQLSAGSWPDIDYGDSGKTRWKPRRHVARLREMAAAYRDGRSQSLSGIRHISSAGYHARDGANPNDCTV